MIAVLMFMLTCAVYSTGAIVAQEAGVYSTQDGTITVTFPGKPKAAADGSGADYQSAKLIYSVMQNGIDDGGDFTDLKDHGLAPRKRR